MRKKRKSEESGFNIWRSYSDMMAGVLLLFVLIMCVTLFQAQKSYEESIKERDEKMELQDIYTMQLEAQQKELNLQDIELKTKGKELEEQKEILAELRAQLIAQQNTLEKQELSLEEKTALLTSQQKKIDKIIGVKAEVVESLKAEFSKKNINVDIDSRTGALTLEASVLFDYDDAELTSAGKKALKKVLPVYCKVLLEESHKPYLAEIIIDGYTDTDGDYYYNLELSQKRSLAVAEYLTDIQYDFLSDEEIGDLEGYLTVNGHSKANPILDAEGNVDKEASRRVEIKFRLKDDEMIDELNKIMSEEKSNDTKEKDKKTDEKTTEDKEAQNKKSDE